MPSQAQSQGHAGVTWRPTGEWAPQQKGPFHTHRSSKAGLLTLSTQPHSRGEWTYTTKGTAPVGGLGSSILKLLQMFYSNQIMSEISFPEMLLFPIQALE